MQAFIEEWRTDLDRRGRSQPSRRVGTPLRRPDVEQMAGACSSHDGPSLPFADEARSGAIARRSSAATHAPQQLLARGSLSDLLTLSKLEQMREGVATPQMTANRRWRLRAGL